VTDVITEAVDHLLREPYVVPPRRHRPIRPTCVTCDGKGYRTDQRRFGFIRIECGDCGGKGRL
jgi:hypothetical protein